MPEIRVRNKRSRKDTQQMILDMAKYGDHSIERREGVPLETDQDVRRYVEEFDVSFEEFVQEHRNRDENVSIFENLLSGAWYVDSTGGSVSYVDETCEETVLASDGEAGWFTIPGYLGLFEQAVEDFNRCVGSTKYGDFLPCVSNGVASIEAYIKQKARIYNKHNPGNQLIDSERSRS